MGYKIQEEYLNSIGTKVNLSITFFSKDILIKELFFFKEQLVPRSKGTYKKMDLSGVLKKGLLHQEGG